MKNCLYEEGENLPYVMPYDRTSGQGVLVGSMFGVVMNDAQQGASVVVVSEGVFTLTKATGSNTGASAGAVAYWDDSAKKITAVSTNNTKVGSFFLTAADADATAAVKLNGTV